MRNILKTSILLSFVFIAINCTVREDQNCTIEIPAAAIFIEGPSEVMVNEEIELDVAFFRASPCLVFNRFITAQMNTTTFNSTIYVANPTCDCPNEPTTGMAVFKYTPTIPGEYTFRFNTSETEYIFKTVTVSE